MRVKRGLMPFVILVVICGVWSSGIGGTDGKISGNSTSVSRYIRAANGDKMSVAVDRMQKVSRLTTGISVQLGLISGSIQSDPLISEVLRLGSVTPSDIVALDSGKLTEAMDQMRELPNTLVDSKGIEDIEGKLKKIEEVRKMVKKFGGETKWVGKEGFKEEVEFVKKGLDLKAVQDISKLMRSWETYKDEIAGIQQVDVQNLADTNSKVNSLKKYTEDIEKLIATLVNLNGKGWSYPKMAKAEDHLKPVDMMKRAVKKVEDYSDVGGTPVEEKEMLAATENNIQTISKLSESLTGVYSDLQMIENIVRSRSSSQKGGLEYPGFMNGLADMDSLFDDLSDDWMGEIVKVDSMFSSLKPLRSLLRYFKQIDNAFGKYGNEKAEMFSKYLKHVEGIQKEKMDSKEISKAFQGFWGCKKEFTKFRAPSDNDLEKFRNQVIELDQKMGELKNGLEKFKTTLSSENVAKLLGEVKKLCVTANDVAQLTNIIKQFQDSPATKDLQLQLKNADDEFAAIQKTPKEAQDLAVKVLQQVKHVDSYIGSLKGYDALFKCLHGLGDEKPKIIAAGTTLSKQFRTTKDNDQVVNDGDEVVNGVVSSIEGFNRLKTAIGDMKNQKGEKLEALNALAEPEKNSKVIGAAVQGVSAMKEALDKKAHGDVIILNSGVVEAQIQSVQLEQADIDNLNAVVQLKDPLTAMYQKLNVWKNGVTDATSKTLVDHSSLFSTAKSVSGVTGDLGAMAKSVDTLIKAITDNTAKKQLVLVRKALESLDTFGLNFASYSTQLDGSKDTLAALDLFFADYTNQMTPTKPPPPPTLPPSLPLECPSDPSASALSAGIESPQSVDCKCPECEDPLVGDLEIYICVIILVGSLILLLEAAVALTLHKRKELKHERINNEKEKTTKEHSGSKDRKKGKKVRSAESGSKSRGTAEEV